MTGVKPTDRTRTDAGKHRPVLVGRFEKLVHAQTSPKAHHLQRVSFANIDDISRQDLFLNLLF
jgi:hypothetical protein